jgi:hypothetical protein
VGHLRTSGFPVDARDVPDIVRVKRKLGVPAGLEACHTATVDGYVIEGHVPADVIDHLLRDRPRGAGLAVPGMPAGSPGMESNYPVPYSIVAFKADGTTYEFARR